MKFFIKFLPILPFYNPENTRKPFFQGFIKWGYFLETGYEKCDALRDLVTFVQFKKREKHTWRSVNLVKL